MNLKNSVMSLNKTSDCLNESDFGMPRIVKKGYIYNESIDSRVNEKINCDLIISNDFNEEKSTDKEIYPSIKKKTVTFNEDLEIFLIKSYKKYNRTGKHDNSCLCRLF